MTSVTVLDKRCADHKDTHISHLLGKNQLISFVNYHFTQLTIRLAIIVLDAVHNGKCKGPFNVKVYCVIAPVFLSEFLKEVEPGAAKLSLLICLKMKIVQ